MAHLPHDGQWFRHSHCSATKARRSSRDEVEMEGGVIFFFTKLNGYDIYALRLCVQNSCLKRLPHCTQSRNAQACCTAHYAWRTMVLPIGQMCCQHQHLGYLPIFGCIGCIKHHVGNVAVGERLFAFVTGRFRPSTSEWVSISLISFNFSVFRLLIMRLWPDVANLRAQACPILLVAPMVKAML